MTKQDFQVIADVLSMAAIPENFKEYLAELFADSLRHTNPRFDRERFLNACLN